MTKNHRGNTVLIAIVALAVIGALIFFLTRSDGGDLGGVRSGLQEFVDGIKPGDVPVKYVSKTLPPQQNAVLLYRNTSGKDVIVDFGSITIPTGETSSTTYKMSLFATTSSAIPATQDFTALAEGKRTLVGTSVATSSTATTTNSVYAAKANEGNGAVLVPNNSYVYGYIQNLAAGGGGAGCTGATCETATSTNRGTNPVFNIRIHGLYAGTLSL